MISNESKCDRCGQLTTIKVSSSFKNEMICMSCKEKQWKDQKFKKILNFIKNRHT